MGEKKMVKVSLGSLIYLFIIVILISIIAGMWVYYNSDKILKKNNNVQQANAVQSTNKTSTVDNSVQQSNAIVSNNTSNPTSTESNNRLDENNSQELFLSKLKI